MATVLNRFLSRLQLPDVKEQNNSGRDQDTKRVEISSLQSRNYWRESENECENDGIMIVNDDLQRVKTENKHSRRGKKLQISSENRWKTADNTISNRPIGALEALLTVGAVVIALYATYCDMTADVQITAYTAAVGLFIVFDPLALFSRLLSRNSRIITAFCMAAFTVSRWTWDDGIVRVCYISIAIGLALVASLNSFWVKAEHFIMSESVEKGLRGDPDNQAGKSWQANGRRKVWTALDTIGVIAKNEDIDTVFKLVYFVGFWECYSFQKDQSRKLNELNTELLAVKATQERAIANGLADLEEENERLLSDYNELIAEYNELVDEKERLEAELEEIREDEEQAGQEEREEVPKLPSWVDYATYCRVMELVDSGEPKKSIERITGISRYKIDQLKALRDNSRTEDEAEPDTLENIKVVNFA